MLNPNKAERHPAEMILVGFFYASLSLVCSNWLFPEYSSITAVFLTTISCLYIIQGAILIEEEREGKFESEKSLLKHHSGVIALIFYLFVGFFLAFLFWNIILPESLSTNLFEAQKNEVENIQRITGRSVAFGDFATIFINNLKVMGISVLFAVFYGSGAVFILAWNASVIGFVIGEIIKNTTGISALPILLFKYAIHGIPEMVAYFVAALAGGILFVTIIRGDYSKDRIIRTCIDFSVLIFISIVLLGIAGIVESYFSSAI